MADSKLFIGITQGDTNSIGWEVILKTFQNPMMTELCTPVIYGSRDAASFYASRIADLQKIQFNICSNASQAKRNHVNLVDTGKVEITPGQITEEGAKQALLALEKACEDLDSKHIAALVTAPICKEAMQKIDFKHTGHTEYFESRYEGRAIMILQSEQMRVALSTIHIPIEEVATAISAESILEQLLALRVTLKKDYGVVEPRIAVLSLNPHCGDGGMIGLQEKQIIEPAIKEAYNQGVFAFGPISADGIFTGGAYKKYDAILAMYHDQGLAPFKAINPFGVNFTSGLEVIRVSPDHGVAFDIAGKGEADETSMRNAVYAAIDIARKRKSFMEWSEHPLEHFEREKGRDVSLKDLTDNTQEEEE
ncbi:MAG: 4-hydroxythreonine-4-phosphate dehydrogenase PdxA [Alistipes sp.]|nr:4-hydroxythreonine-4-phosphate dehydrogenase PdxA [Candidatus Alistipes equi]